MDVDTGTDDSIAIMLAVLSKKFDILGISVTWGNQEVEYCVANTLRVLDFLDSDIPVYQGCHEPMVLDLDEKRVEGHIGDVIAYFDEKGKEHHLHPKKLPFKNSKRKVEDKHAVSFLVDTLMHAKDKITLVPVGPCTNIGMALRMEPRIAEHIEEIVFMGGSDDMGNVTKTAEANFWHDPEAVKIILKSKVKCVIASLNATTSVPLTIDDVEVLEKLKTKYAKKAAEIVRLRMDVSKHLGWSDGNIETVHDPLAIAYLLDEKVASDILRCDGDIVLGGKKDGTLILKENNEGSVYFIRKADKDRYFDIWKRCLGQDA